MLPAKRGYTLIELVVAVGIFALIMTLASGAYLVMIGVNRQAQSTATGINNLSFVLESLTRNVRTGTGYQPISATSFSFKNQDDTVLTYALGSQSGPNGTVGAITLNGAPLTDPLVDITSLTFYTSGTASSDTYQPYVTITLSGTISAGPGKTQSFSVETSAAMRGSDLGTLVLPPPPPTTVTVFLTSGTSWTVPTGVTTLTSVEVIGGGGAGINGNSGSGGGGGAYASITNLSVTSGGLITYQIGAGGASAGADASDTLFNRTSGNDTMCKKDVMSVCADGGSGAGAAGGGGGQDDARSIGSVIYRGGNGGTGAQNSGGGGGGAGGPGGAGGAGGAGGGSRNAGGGGGGGGGAAGQAGQPSAGGAGGNNVAGTGGGSGSTLSVDCGATTAALAGGGGGGGFSTGGAGGITLHQFGCAGSTGIEWDVAHGAGGGGGGNSDNASASPGAGGLYGAGGAGGSSGVSYFGAGGSGLIVITYTL
ncbi:MAG: prepilin-type N-terminal cleavage/methylation domain-containing protein [bacterium]|nr:prepilin-type N-terminal cleavage/methylation domain-containing protein [bacterium]